MRNIENRNGRDSQIIARAQKWAEVLKEFHGSGQTRNAFARERGIAVSTLNYWLMRQKRKTLNAEAARAVGGPKMVFSELKMSAQGLSSASGWAMEVVSPMGLTIRSRKELPADLLIRLLRGEGC